METKEKLEDGRRLEVLESEQGRTSKLYELYEPCKISGTTEGRRSTKSVAFNSGMESDCVGSSSAENKNELSIGG